MVLYEREFMVLAHPWFEPMVFSSIHGIEPMVLDGVSGFLELTVSIYSLSLTLIWSLDSGCNEMLLE